MVESMGASQTTTTISGKGYNPLNKEEARVIINKGTEYAGRGEYTNNKALGLYLCRQCNAPLYTSEMKF